MQDCCVRLQATASKGLSNSFEGFVSLVKNRRTSKSMAVVMDNFLKIFIHIHISFRKPFWVSSCFTALWKVLLHTASVLFCRCKYFCLNFIQNFFLQSVAKWLLSFLQFSSCEFIIADADCCVCHPQGR